MDSCCRIDGPIKQTLGWLNRNFIIHGIDTIAHKFVCIYVNTEQVQNFTSPLLNESPTLATWLIGFADLHEIQRAFSVYLQWKHIIIEWLQFKPRINCILPSSVVAIKCWTTIEIVVIAHCLNCNSCRPFVNINDWTKWWIQRNLFEWFRKIDEITRKI